MSSSLRKAATLPNSFEVNGLEDFDGGKAFEGTVISMNNNPLENLRKRIAIDHIKTLSEKTSDQCNSVCPIDGGEIFRNINLFSSGAEDLQTGVHSTRRPLQIKSHSGILTTRAQFTPPPKLYQSPKSQPEFDCFGEL